MLAASLSTIVHHVYLEFLSLNAMNLALPILEFVEKVEHADETCCAKLNTDVTARDDSQSETKDKKMMGQDIVIEIQAIITMIRPTRHYRITMEVLDFLSAQTARWVAQT